MITAASVSVLLGLSGCSTSAPGNRPAPAEPSFSAATSEPDSVVTVKESELSDGFRMMTRSGDAIAGLSGDHVAIGRVTQWQQGDPTLISVDPKCQDLSPFDGGFTLACPGEVLTFDTEGHAGESLTVDGTATTAARVGTMTVVTLADEHKVHFYDGSEHVHDADMENIPSQSLVVQPDPAQPNETPKVVVLDRSMTMVTGINVEDKSVGASLRVGRGAGMMSGGDDGVFAVADTRGNALYMYTLTDLIRLHQTIATDAAPWAVAWDASSGTVWGASTADTTVSGYAVSSGALVQQAHLPTLSQPASMATLPDGGLIIGAADRPAVQIVTPEDIADAQPDPDHETEFPVRPEEAQ